MSIHHDLPLFYLISCISHVIVHTSQRPPCIFSSPYLNQASPSTCNVQHCLYLLKSYFVQDLVKMPSFPTSLGTSFSFLPWISRVQIYSSLSYWLLSHVLLHFIYLCTGLIIPIKFQGLGDSDNNIITVIITITTISSYHIPALWKAYNFISATLGGLSPLSDVIK